MPRQRCSAPFGEEKQTARYARAVHGGNGAFCHAPYRAACQDFATLMPQLEPDHYCNQLRAAMTVGLLDATLADLHPQLLAVMQLAEKRGCDLAAAMAGYQVVIFLASRLPSLETS